MRTAWTGMLLAVGLGMGAPALAQDTPETKTAVFAGGCFWCMEPPFDKLDGVVATVSGYTGGMAPNPTYEQVSAGRTGHYEAVQVRYDPKKVTYDTLLEVYWRQVDPFDSSGQFCDRGKQYTTAIFAATDQERHLAEASKESIAKRLGKPVVTPVLPAATFFPAEDYHQDYYKKNPLRYNYYRFTCGRDKRLEQVWGGQPSG
ncbi:MAG TPA: peptide-methionine (S)-S-oxide reductase MsrA [Azospirillum sp.]|nr:peptide-methionine (S)-S-oxide reductase MsrA [Azospirillum sp.]